MTVDVAVDRGSARTRVMVSGSGEVLDVSAGVRLDEAVRMATDQPIRRAAITIPEDLSGAEQRAVQQSLERATGVRPAFLVETAMAAARAGGYTGDGAIGVVDVGASAVRVSVIVLDAVLVHEGRPFSPARGGVQPELVADAIHAAWQRADLQGAADLRWVVVGGNADDDLVRELRHVSGRHVDLVPDPRYAVVRTVAAVLAAIGD